MFLICLQCRLLATLKRITYAGLGIVHFPRHIFVEQESHICSAGKTAEQLEALCDGVQVIGTGKGSKRRSKGGKQKAERPSKREDPGWESEIRVREEEVAHYEERILVKEFKKRLDYNIGKVWKFMASLRLGLVYSTCEHTPTPVHSSHAFAHH